MADNVECPYREVIENSVHSNTNKIEALNEKMSEFDKNTAVLIAHLSDAVDHLSQLPEAINLIRESLDKTNNETSALTSKVDSISGKIDKMEKRVVEIDNRDKISMLDWMKKNWFTIFLTLGMAALWAKQQGWI